MDFKYIREYIINSLDTLLLDTDANFRMNDGTLCIAQEADLDMAINVLASRIVSINKQLEEK